MTDPLLVEDRGDRTVVLLNRPEVRNAIDLATVEALHDVCRALESEPKVALIRGAGGDFAAGADIAQLRERRRDDALRGINSGIFDRIRRLPMPVIGLVEGFALGGGAELAYACDFRIGTSTTRIGNPEPGLGILAAAGAGWRLNELVGEPLAKEISWPVGSSTPRRRSRVTCSTRWRRTSRQPATAWPTGSSLALVDKKTEAWKAAIRRAAAAGTPKTELVKVAGVNRARVYKILDED